MHKCMLALLTLLPGRVFQHAGCPSLAVLSGRFPVVFGFQPIAQPAASSHGAGVCDPACTRYPAHLSLLPLRNTPSPPLIARPTEAPTNFDPITVDDPYSNAYYSIEVPGVFKYIFLTSYAPNQAFNDTNDEQYQWLEEELKSVSLVRP